MPNAKEVVLEKYPAAYAHFPFREGGWCWIDIARDTPMLGEGPTEEDAWINAAQNLQ